MLRKVVRAQRMSTRSLAGAARGSKCQSARRSETHWRTWNPGWRSSSTSGPLQSALRGIPCCLLISARPIVRPTGTAVGISHDSAPRSGLHVDLLNGSTMGPHWTRLRIDAASFRFGRRNGYSSQTLPLGLSGSGSGYPPMDPLHLGHSLTTTLIP